MKLNLRELEIRDLRGAAYHEVGHYIVGSHYGLDGPVTVERAGSPTLLDRSWTGQTSICTALVTPFQQSVIGWSGVLAEGLMDIPLVDWEFDIEDVAVVVMDDYWSEVPSSLSATDRFFINKTKLFRRAFNRACALVVLQGSDIIEFAEQIIADELPKLNERYSEVEAVA